jgi:hypothetical protein
MRAGGTGSNCRSGKFGFGPCCSQHLFSGVNACRLHLSLFVLGITAGIFLVVFSLLAYAVIKFPRRAGDDDGEPLQIYGSNQVSRRGRSYRFSSWSCFFSPLRGSSMP